MVYILLGTGFEEAEALVPADLLRRADIPVALVGVDGLSVTGSHGITVAADCSLEQVDRKELELLFLPGGLGGVAAIKASAAAMDLISFTANSNRPIAAICAAPTILAELGLLKGKRAVCFPTLQHKLTGAQVQADCPVVVDGNIITGEAAGSAFPFGLKLIEVLRGAETAQKIHDSVYLHD